MRFQDIIEREELTSDCEKLKRVKDEIKKIFCNEYDERLIKFLCKTRKELNRVITEEEYRILKMYNEFLKENS